MDELVLRDGDLFQVCDRRGDILAVAPGLVTRDTRYLSRFELLVDGERPDLAPAVGGLGLAWSGPARVVERRRVLYGGAMYERIILRGFGESSTAATAEVRFAADFVDIFELRGFQRPARGTALAPVVGDGRVRLGYRGLDGVLRETELRFSPAPDVLTSDVAVWRVAGRDACLDVVVLPAENGRFPAAVGFEAASSLAAAASGGWRSACTAIESDCDWLNQILEQTDADLQMLLTDLGQGPFFVAGIPWFAVPFGRDSIIAALQALPLNPDLARGTLRTLAALQGRTVDGWRQEEPGKIPHEIRFGEMANLDEVPFGRYYGSVDSTPLFLVLLGEYYAWTGDLGLVRELLPFVLAALEWIGDGFLSFQADDAMGGLRVKSWKDSPDSISHRDGRLAAGSLAVAEVQGYVYDAKRRLAPIFRALGDFARAALLEAEAAALASRFAAAFWIDAEQCPAIALENDSTLVESVASDMGHCLWSRLLTPAQAGGVAERLLAPDLFSGWGIRTLRCGAVRYDPASYHNGSVWPHDTALAALGLKRYGCDAAANRVVGGLLEAAASFGGRLPELFCGDGQEAGAPVAYAGACSPQAWAAGAPLMLVQAMLGLEPDAPAGVLRLRPCLPASVGRLTLRGLRVGGARVDLEVTPAAVRVAVREGGICVLVTDRV